MIDDNNNKCLDSSFYYNNWPTIITQMKKNQKPQQLPPKSKK